MKSRWFATEPSAHGAALRLFCAPYAGGGAGAFKGWQEVLGTWVDLVALRPPGRESRFAEPPLSSVEELATAVATELAKCGDRPFALFGHSLGAMVAFETARRLQDSGGPMPVHLVVSGRRAPHLPSRHPQVHALSSAEFQAELKRFEGTPKELLDNAELMELMDPVLRADFKAAEVYVHRPGPPLSCSITALGGLSDPWVEPGELEGWAEHTSSACNVRLFPGRHFFIHSATAAVLDVIARALATHQ